MELFLVFLRFDGGGGLYYRFGCFFAGYLTFDEEPRTYSLEFFGADTTCLNYFGLYLGN